MMGKGKQGAWTKWEHAAGQTIIWTVFWKVEDNIGAYSQQLWDKPQQAATLDKAHLRFPDTTLGPDIVLFSRESKQVILLELTVT